MSIATGGLQRVRYHRRHLPGGGEVIDEAFDERPGLWEELQTTIARLHKFGGSADTGAHAAESPVPYHERASTVAHRMRNEVGTWARAMADTYSHLTLTATSTPAAARWLATFPGLLVEHLAYAEMCAGITAVVRDAERVIDRAPDKVYAGPCLEPLTAEDEAKLAEIEATLAEDPGADVEHVDRCPGHLYAKPGKNVVRCRDCGTAHDVATRQRWLSNQLGPSLVTAAEAAPVLSWLLDKDIKVDTIHKWRTRHGRIQAHGEYLGRPLFRFNELAVLAREVKTRASKPRDKKGSAA